MALATPVIENVAASFVDMLKDLELVRKGGQAIVYKATRIRNASGLEVEEPVALKIYFDESQDERVEREIQTALDVRSDCLCSLLAHGHANIGGTKYRYLLWSYIDGEPLDGFLKQAVADPILVCIIGRDVAKGIQAIWEQRIVHRDVNPKNIMLKRGHESAVLIDLGVAKFLDQSPLTGTGLTWGTAGYLSPEQMAGAPLTCQSDVFSLGITLQEALCAQHPTKSDQRALGSGGPRTHTIAANAPALLANVLDRMVGPRPARRPGPAELVEIFSSLLVGR